MSGNQPQQGRRGAAATMPRPAPRKRRRGSTPHEPDWDLPFLTQWGLKPSQQRLLVIIASVAGALVSAVVLVVVVSSLGSDATPDRLSAAAGLPELTRPEDYHAWPSPQQLAPIADRAKDARPLTVKEVFGAKTLNGESKSRPSLKLAASTLDTDCASALWGQELIERTREAGCTQAARGLYLSSDRRYVTQYTLLNLRDGKAANELVAALKTLHRGGWTRPLDSDRAGMPPGGYTEAGGYALGHYVGLVWTARVDGVEPTPKDDFVNLALTLRGAEKVVYRRVVSITGPTPS